MRKDKRIATNVHVQTRASLVCMMSVISQLILLRQLAETFMYDVLQLFDIIVNKPL